MRTQSLLTSLTQLQVGQHRHDLLAHQDIMSLLVPKRLTHFTLHFAKYQGGLSKAIRAGDSEMVGRLLTDSLIILLAAANAMNLNLHDRLGGSSGSRHDAHWKSPSSRESILMEYLEIVADMAKACEVLDHMENFPSREVLEKSVLDLLCVVDRFANTERIDLPAMVSDRWMQVEGKLFLNDESALQAKVKPRAAAAVA